jgi:hypothetical protein
MGHRPPRDCGGQRPKRVREGNVEPLIRCTPEGEEVIERESLDIRIFGDVLRVIPQYKLMTVDLPEDHQRREDQEAYQDTRKP